MLFLKILQIIVIINIGKLMLLIKKVISIFKKNLISKKKDYTYKIKLKLF